MDTEIDLDPREQRNRKAAEVLARVKEKLEGVFFEALDDARDNRFYAASLAVQKRDAHKLAARATRLYFQESDLPYTVTPVYFRFGDEA